MFQKGCFIFLLSIFIACQNNSDSTEKYSIFRYNEANGISSLDPAFARNLENISAVNQLYNGLVQMDDHLNVIPAIAKSWLISDSGTTYTFHLRNDVYFHDNKLFENKKDRKVLAKDFVYSFNRIVDEKLASPGAWVFNLVVKDSNGNYSFKAIDDSTFQIQLTQAFPPFLGILSMQYCSVVPQVVVNCFQDDFRNNAVGTGPFQLKYWSESNKLVLIKNPDYFEKDDLGNSLPYLDAINVIFNKDEEVAFLKFLKGDIDYLSGLNGSYKDEILNSNGELKSKYKDKINMITVPYLNTEYLGFNLQAEHILDGSSPLANLKVRQAINYGFDRKKMLLYLRNGIGTAAEMGFIPKGLAAFNKNFKGYYYNPEKAKQLLAEAGFPNGVGLQPIILNTTAQYLDLCEYIQHELTQIGLQIKIEVNPAGTHNELVAKGDMEFFRKSWIADYPDAENYLALFYSPNFAPKGPNYMRFKNALYDDLYEKALLETNDSLRNTYYHQMDSMIISEAAIVPLFYDNVVRFTSKDISALGVNPMNLLSLKKVKKTPEILK